MRGLSKLGTAGAKALSLAALLLSGTAGNAKFAYVKEYPIPFAVGYGNPRDITTGPDGALWFVDDSQSGTVWRVTTAGVFGNFAQFIPSWMYGAYPDAITAGPDGAMWVTLRSSGYFQIFNASKGTGYRVFSYPHIASLRSITAGPDGALWFTGTWVTYPSGSLVEKIGRITTSGAVTEYPVPYAVNSLFAAPDGTLWFWGGGPWRITTAGVILENHFQFPSGASWIITGPDSAFWFTDPASSKIGRITIDGMLTEYPTPTPDSNPRNITLGPDGALWFMEQFKIGRITTAGDITEYGIYFSNPPYNPTSMAAASDGSLWFIDGSGVIRQIVLTDEAPIRTRMSPLPLQPTMVANFPVQWSGVGADSYTLYVLDNNGLPFPWLTTTATQAIFPGVLDHHYAFYSIGTDLSGNVEKKAIGAWPPEAVAYVAAAPGDLTGDGAVNCADLAVVMASFGKRTGQPGFNPVADVNQDGVVNVRDLSWVAQYLVPGSQCQ